MTKEQNFSSNKNETPCLNCNHMIECKEMCYKRLEWGIFDARVNDEEALIYGNNIKVRSKNEIVKQKKQFLSDEDRMVQELLDEFEQIYRQEVIALTMREKQRLEDLKRYQESLDRLI